MVAAVNHKCIRLIRTSIEDIELGMMQPGDVKEISETQFFEKLHLA
jgi:23S rRNA pseudouridine2457 synthase